MAISFLLTDTELPADCLSTDAVGDCIQFTGDLLGDRYQVTRADPRALIQASGVIIRKATSTQCTIRMAGLMTGIVSGFVPNGLVWLGINGRLEQDRALITALPGGKVLVQPLGFAATSTTVFLLPQAPYVKIPG